MFVRWLEYDKSQDSWIDKKTIYNEVKKRQQNKIRIRDYDKIDCVSDLEKIKKRTVPNNIRRIICGPSNCGKTNVMFNLLFDSNGLRFESVYVFSKSFYQPNYKLLDNIFSKIPLIGYYTFSDNDEVKHPNEAKPNSVIVFDDIACERQTNIRNYFAMGRHNNIDVFIYVSHIVKYLNN